MDNNLLFLSTRKGFNNALNHFKIVTGLLNDFQRKNNLADILNSALNNRKIRVDQVVPIINITLVDKFNYYFKSINLQISKEENFSKLADKVRKWDMLDFVILYHHPQLGELIINPKNEKSWELVEGGLKENELVNVYAGNFSEPVDEELADKGIKAIIALIYGEIVSEERNFISTMSPYKNKKVEKPKEIKEGKKAIEPSEELKFEIPIVAPTPRLAINVKKKLSPGFGITVTNELFHNGNVEAWKKIIESYETKYTDLKVVIFYDKEEIKDINTLFKWGKVKHGTMIIMRVLGVEFKDVSKLRRYLFEGASPKFENFLKARPGHILSLF